MIGQKELIKLVKSQIKNKDFPRFSIIVGARGSGKKSLTDIITKTMKLNYSYRSGIAVSQVRDAISQMYKSVDTTVFTFYDADEMSVQAKNALLKVAEEPPHNVHIIMTVTDLNNVLSTIKSRAFIYRMEPYSPKDLIKYASEYGKTMNGKLITDLCETPGDVNMLHDCNAQALYNYATLTVDNIAEVSDANALKLGSKIAFKDDDSGFDMLLFLKAFRQICMDRMCTAIIDGVQEEINRYASGVDAVNHTISQLHITGINKSHIFDMFILDIRKVWK